MPLVTGVAGGFTPCALGINTLFVGALADKPRPVRLAQWTLLVIWADVFARLFPV